MPYADEGFGRIVDGWFAQTDAILIGRTTYEMFYGYWPQVTEPDDLVATQLNQRPKYVVSTTLTEASWHNSTVICGDVVKAVADLKAQPGRELQVHGSCQLAQTLHDAGLIDEYRLLVFPLVLGVGKRLFKDGCIPTSFSLVDTQATPAGVVAHTFRPAGTPSSSTTFAVVDGKETVQPIQ